MLVYPLSPSNSAAEKHRNLPGHRFKMAPDSKAKGDSVHFSVTALVKSHVLQGLSPDQIASKMGLPLSSVKSHLGGPFSSRI